MIQAYYYTNKGNDDSYHSKWNASTTVQIHLFLFVTQHSTTTTHIYISLCLNALWGRNSVAILTHWYQGHYNYAMKKHTIASKFCFVGNESSQQAVVLWKRQGFQRTFDLFNYFTEYIVRTYNEKNLVHTNYHFTSLVEFINTERCDFIFLQTQINCIIQYRTKSAFTSGI